MTLHMGVFCLCSFDVSLLTSLLCLFCLSLLLTDQRENVVDNQLVLVKVDVEPSNELIRYLRIVRQVKLGQRAILFDDLDYVARLCTGIRIKKTRVASRK